MIPFLRYFSRLTEWSSNEEAGTFIQPDLRLPFSTQLHNSSTNPYSQSSTRTNTNEFRSSQSWLYFSHLNQDPTLTINQSQFNFNPPLSYLTFPSNMLRLFPLTLALTALLQFTTLTRAAPASEPQNYCPPPCWTAKLCSCSGYSTADQYVNSSPFWYIKRKSRC
jgi:hypothetical protein